MKMSERLSWDQYFMTITQQVAERSTCTRAKVGAVIVRDKNILATGYNGAPAGMPHCTEKPSRTAFAPSTRK
jgi:dCMP deaminase